MARVMWGFARASKLEARIAALEKQLEATKALSVEQLQSAHLIIGVGSIAIYWAGVEAGLDYANYFILHAVPGGAALASELPRAFDRKLELFERAHDRLTALAPYRKRGNEIASEAKRLKDHRHDFVHGVALQLTGAIRYRRLILKADRINRVERSYDARRVDSLAQEIRTLSLWAMDHSERISAELVGD
jgi:hypothetical protein